MWRRDCHRATISLIHLSQGHEASPLRWLPAKTKSPAKRTRSPRAASTPCSTELTKKHFHEVPTTYFDKADKFEFRFPTREFTRGVFISAQDAVLTPGRHRLPKAIKGPVS